MSHTATTSPPDVRDRVPEPPHSSSDELHATCPSKACTSWTTDGVWPSLPCGAHPLASVQPRARHRSLKWPVDKVVLMGVHQVKTHPMPSRRRMQRRRCVGQIRPSRHFVGTATNQRALQLGQTRCTWQCHVDGQTLRHASTDAPPRPHHVLTPWPTTPPPPHCHACALENTCANLKCCASGQHIVHQHHAHAGARVLPDRHRLSPTPFGARRGTRRSGTPGARPAPTGPCAIHNPRQRPTPLQSLEAG